MIPGPTLQSSLVCDYSVRAAAPVYFLRFPLLNSVGVALRHTEASRLKSGNRKRALASFPPFTGTVFAFRLLHGHVESQTGAIRYSAKVWRRRPFPLRPQWIFGADS